MKRILMLNYEFPPLGGGASPVSYELAKSFVKTGDQVSVVTMGFKGLPKHEIKDGIKIYRVPAFRRKKEMSYPWEQAIYLVSATIFLFNHLRKYKYDINQTFFIIPTGVLSLLIKHTHKLKYVVTSQGSDVIGYNPRFAKLYPVTKIPWKWVIDGAEYIVTPSKFLMSQIEEVYPKLEAEKKIVIPNAFDTDKFKLQKKKKYILSSGRLMPNKGFHFLIEAVKDIDSDYELRIAGDGPMMKELKDLSKGSKTNIVFYGWLDNKSKKYKNLVEQASIFALISLKENASISLSEAMSAGAAIVTTNRTGCAEMVGDAGVQVEFGNVEEIRSAIFKLINNPDILAKYQKKARKRAIENFSWKKVVQQYQALKI